MNKKQILKEIEEIIELETEHTMYKMVAFDKLLKLRDKLKKEAFGE